MINQVENEILDEISKNYGSKIVDLINKLPIDQKRIAMFAAISSKKDTSHKDMLNTLKNSENSVIIKQIDKIIERFRKYVPIGQVEKKSFGEVFTPFTLVNEMLDTLPVEVWSNPNLKWADLCNGMGNFMIIVVKRLMIGLESWEPNEVKRYRHIIEKMIYVAELQPKNMFLWMLSIDPKSKLNLNIYTGNSLESGLDEHMKNVWKVDKFDIIVGNPPYQELKEGNKKSKPIWNLFVEKYLNLLKENGYMVMIHPSGWRNADGAFKNIKKILTDRQIMYLNINTYKDGLNIFNAKTDFDFYCVKNTLNLNKTKIIDIDNNIDYINLYNAPFIPSCNISKVLSLVAKDDDEKVNILFNSAYHHQRNHMNKEKTETYKYTCIQNINVKNEISCVWYSNTNKNGHFNIPKIIFGRKSSGVFIDENGEYGMSEDCGAIIDSVENLKNIKIALENNFFIKNIMGFRNALGDKYNKKIIATFRKDFWKEFIN